MYNFTHEEFKKIIENEDFRNFIIKEVRPYIDEYEKQKTKLDKRHDKIFKNILSKKSEAVNFINKKFSLNLKPEDIELYDKEFRKKGGRVLEADIIYKVKDKKVFFLIEHQTKNDYHMAFKVLNYQIEVMRTCEAKDIEEKEALVLAAVIHTGKDKWKAKRSIRELQEDIYNRGFKIDFDIETLGTYMLEDINDYTKEELLESKSLLYKTMYLEKVKDTNEFIDSCKEVFKRITKEEYKIMSEVIRIALSGNMPDKEIEEFIVKLNKKGEKNMLALKETIDAEFRMHKEIGRKEGEEMGLDLGMRLGKEEGKREEKRILVGKLIKKGNSIVEIAELVELDKEEIMKIKKEIEKNKKKKEQK